VRRRACKSGGSNAEPASEPARAQQNSLLLMIPLLLSIKFPTVMVCPSWWTASLIFGKRDLLKPSIGGHHINERGMKSSCIKM
jgi:hypothetical protein